MICTSNLVQQGALCYPPCKTNYVAQGPVCWGNCPSGLTSCGGLCTQSAADCTSVVLSDIQNVMQTVMDIAEAFEDPVSIISVVADGATTIQGFAQYGTCTYPSD